MYRPRDGVCELGQHEDRSVTMICFMDPKPGIFEDPTDIHKDERIVIHDDRVRVC